jgi:hypothetical protein
MGSPLHSLSRGHGNWFPVIMIPTQVARGEAGGGERQGVTLSIPPLPSMHCSAHGPCP